MIKYNGTTALSLYSNSLVENERTSLRVLWIRPKMKAPAKAAVGGSIMKKKVLSVFLCGVMAASMLAGCGSSGKEEVATNTDAEDAAAENEADGEDTEVASEDSRHGLCGR